MDCKPCFFISHLPVSPPYFHLSSPLSSSHFFLKRDYLAALEASVDLKAEEEEEEAIEDVLSSLVASLPDAHREPLSELTAIDRARHLPEGTAGLNRKLSASVRKGELNPHRALLAGQHIDREVGAEHSRPRRRPFALS